MASIIELILSILYPFGYFLALGVVLEISKIATLFFVGAGRLKAFHAIENYWIYLLVMLLCLLIAVVIGHGDLLAFARWFICTQLAGLIGIHYGYDKAMGMSDEDLKDLADGSEFED